LVHRTAYARERLAEVNGVSLAHRQPVVREFAVSLDAPVDRVIERCAAHGINPGYALGSDYPELEDGLLVALTERRTRSDIDQLAQVLSTAVAAERESVGTRA
jgi:glycine dehydrogenase subunit 1